MDRLISEKAVIDAIINYVGVGKKAYLFSELIKAIPSAEPYKGMTNGEVLKAVFSNIDFCRNEFDGSMWVDMEDIATFKLDWWNSPYEPQEISDCNLKMWHDIFEEEKRRVRSNKE